MSERRRLFAPRSTFDRVVYALLAAAGPGAALQYGFGYRLVFEACVLGLWSLIAVIYTILWALELYRRWRTRRVEG